LGFGKVPQTAEVGGPVCRVSRAKWFCRCYAQTDCHAGHLRHPRSRKQAGEHWGDDMTISRAEMPTEELKELPYVEEEPAARPDRRRFIVVGGAGVVVVIAAIVASVVMAAGGLSPTANQQPLPGKNDAAAGKPSVPNARAINPEPPAAAAPPAPAPTPAPVAGLPGGLPGSTGGAPAGGLPSFGSISRPAASSGSSGAGGWPFALPDAPAWPTPGMPNVNWPLEVPLSVPLQIPVTWPISLPGIDFPDLVINDLLWLAVMGFQQLPAAQWPPGAPAPAAAGLQALQALQVPQFGAPQLPQFQMPPMPQVGMPQLPPPPPVGLPQVGLPQVGLPQVGLPQIGWPQIGLPKIG
jgi:hypothetical protein